MISGTDGVGYEAAIAFVEHDALFVLVGRNMDKIDGHANYSLRYSYIFEDRAAGILHAIFLVDKRAVPLCSRSDHFGTGHH